jgi:hypothetical protein
MVPGGFDGVAPYPPARTKRLSLALRNPHIAGVYRLAAGPDALIGDRRKPAVHSPAITVISALAAIP